MTDLIAKWIGLLLEQIGSILNSVLYYVGQSILPAATVDSAKFGISLYNDMIGDAIAMLTKSPAEWNKAGWLFIKNEVFPVFAAFGSALIVVFFLIGLCQESIDIQREIRLEALLTYFIKIGFAQTMVVKSLDIISVLFEFVDALTGSWFSSSAVISDNIGYTEEQVAALPGIALFVTFIVAVIYMGALIFTAGTIVYTATMRFFKILALIPYGAIASATIAGNREISRTSLHFYKYVLGTVFEAVTMILLLCLFTKIQNSITLVTFSGNNRIIGLLINRILITLLCLGSVKGAGTLTQKAIGV